MKMPFGKHKGLELEDLAKDHPGYVVWLAENCELHGDLFYFVGEHYDACKKNARKNKRRDYLWSDEDIANQEADMRYEHGYDDWADFTYPIPNFDY